jgi:hypothetical protein
MPTTRLQPRAPSSASLIRFFARRAPLPVRDAAELTGIGARTLRVEAREEDALLTDDRVAWPEIAFRVVHAWPRAWLLKALGAHASLIPEQLHLTRVTWDLPVYVVRAMERQAVAHRTARTDVHGLDVQEHVAEILHLAIDDETVTTFAGEPDLYAAYSYPDLAAEGGR